MVVLYLNKTNTYSSIGSYVVGLLGDMQKLYFGISGRTHFPNIFQMNFLILDHWLYQQWLTTYFCNMRFKFNIKRQRKKYFVSLSSSFIKLFFYPESFCLLILMSVNNYWKFSEKNLDVLIRSILLKNLYNSNLYFSPHFYKLIFNRI